MPSAKKTPLQPLISSQWSHHVKTPLRYEFTDQVRILKLWLLHQIYWQQTKYRHIHHVINTWYNHGFILWVIGCPSHYVFNILFLIVKIMSTKRAMPSFREGLHLLENNHHLWSGIYLLHRKVQRNYEVSYSSQNWLSPQQPNSFT